MTDEPGVLEFRELVASLKHDLAKYVAWRSANYGDEAWRGPLTRDFAEALQHDVLRTKGDRPAWDVWDEAATQLLRADGTFAHSELEDVARAVDVLRGCESQILAGNDALGPVRGAIRDAQQVIRSQLSALHRKLSRG